MGRPKKERKPLVITPCDIDCLRSDESVTFTTDKKIICFLCRRWSHTLCTGEESDCLTYVWACRYCRGVAENTNHIHKLASDLKQTISNLSDTVTQLLSRRVNDSNINDNKKIIIPKMSFELSTAVEASIHLLIEELSDIDSEDDFITLTQLSVSDNDSIVHQPHGTTPSASNTRVPPTVPDISNLSLEISKAVDVRLIDNISAASPILHSNPSTLTAPPIHDHDSSDRQNIRDVTIITDISAAQPSSPSQTCNTSSSTPDSRLSVDIVHTVFPPDIKVTYHDVYIGNVRGSTTKDDIRKQLMPMGGCHIGNIIPLRSKNMSTTAFRVFIADQHIDTNVYNKECWHRNIKVEPYRVRIKIYHKNIRIREAEQKAHQQHSSNESTHYAPNRSARSHNPRVPRTPRRVRPQRPPALIAPLMKGQIQ